MVQIIGVLVGVFIVMAIVMAIIYYILKLVYYLLASIFFSLALLGVNVVAFLDKALSWWGQCPPAFQWALSGFIVAFVLQFAATEARKLNRRWVGPTLIAVAVLALTLAGIANLGRGTALFLGTDTGPIAPQTKARSAITPDEDKGMASFGAQQGTHRTLTLRENIGRFSEYLRRDNRFLGPFHNYTLIMPPSVIKDADTRTSENQKYEIAFVGSHGPIYTFRSLDGGIVWSPLPLQETDPYLRKLCEEAVAFVRSGKPLDNLMKHVDAKMNLAAPETPLTSGPSVEAPRPRSTLTRRPNAPSATEDQGNIGSRSKTDQTPIPPHQTATPTFPRFVKVASAAVPAIIKDPASSGGLIVFVARDGTAPNGRGRREVFVMKPDGSGLRSLSAQFSDAFAPRWSPNGKTVLFRGGDHGDLYVINADGTGLTNVLDIDKIAFPRMQSFDMCVGVRWLPDGKTLAVCAGKWPERSKLYLVNLKDAKRRTINLAKAAWSPSWSPDGDQIAFLTYSATADEKHPFQVYLADSQGNNRVPVTDKSVIQSGPHWLPDNKRFIFVKSGEWSHGKQNNRLFTKNTHTGKISETGFHWNVWDIAVSPYGLRIAFTPLHETSPIYIFALAGDVWQQEARIDGGAFPAWSPDGASLVFVSSDGGSLWLVNVDGSGLVKLAPTIGRTVEIEWPQWSPMPGAP